MRQCRVPEWHGPRHGGIESGQIESAYYQSSATRILTLAGCIFILVSRAAAGIMLRLLRILAPSFGQMLASLGHALVRLLFRNQQVYRDALWMLGIFGVCSMGDAAEVQAHHHSSGICHQERIRHTTHRMYTRKNRFVLPWILAEDPCCSTHSLDVVEAFVTPCLVCSLTISGAPSGMPVSSSSTSSTPRVSPPARWSSNWRAR